MRSAFHLVKSLAGSVGLVFAVIACGVPYGEDGGGESSLGTPGASSGGGTSKPGEGSSGTGEGASSSSGAASSSGGGNGGPNAPAGPVLLIGDSGSKLEGWKFDGTSWTGLATGNNPSTRRGFMTASLADKVVLFGGYDPTTNGLAETWTLDPKKLTWTKEAPATSPPGRYGASMTTLKDRVVLFGGVDNLVAGSTRIHSDTWSWNGATWKQEGAPGPSARSGHAMAPLNNGERIILFGGANPSRELDDTWIFELETGWRMLPTGVAHPPACFRCTMAPFGESSVALFGPGLDPQTWVFDGTAWSVKAQAGPSKRVSSMASVAAGTKIILFGGYTNTVSNAHQDTWSFDGKEWTLLHPPSTPPPTVAALSSLVPLP